jgi:hypothetical protein
MENSRRSMIGFRFKSHLEPYALNVGKKFFQVERFGAALERPGDI